MTLAELRALWESRDSRYALWRYSMSEETAASIRDYRRREIDDLPPLDRGKASLAIALWSPPTVRR